MTTRAFKLSTQSADEALKRAADRWAPSPAGGPPSIAAFHALRAQIAREVSEEDTKTIARLKAQLVAADKTNNDLARELRRSESAVHDRNSKIDALRRRLMELRNSKGHQLLAELENEDLTTELNRRMNGGTKA